MTVRNKCVLAALPPINDTRSCQLSGQSSRYLARAEKTGPLAAPLGSSTLERL